MESIILVGIIALGIFFVALAAWIVEKDKCTKCLCYNCENINLCGTCSEQFGYKCREPVTSNKYCNYYCPKNVKK